MNSANGCPVHSLTCLSYRRGARCPVLTYPVSQPGQPLLSYLSLDPRCPSNNPPHCKLKLGQPSLYGDSFFLQLNSGLMRALVDNGVLTWNILYQGHLRSS